MHLLGDEGASGVGQELILGVLGLSRVKEGEREKERVKDILATRVLVQRRKADGVGNLAQWTVEKCLRKMGGVGFEWARELEQEQEQELVKEVEEEEQGQDEFKPLYLPIPGAFSNYHDIIWSQDPDAEIDAARGAASDSEETAAAWAVNSEYIASVLNRDVELRKWNANRTGFYEMRENWVHKKLWERDQLMLRLEEQLERVEEKLQEREREEEREGRGDRDAGGVRLDANLRRLESYINALRREQEGSVRIVAQKEQQLRSLIERLDSAMAVVKEEARKEKMRLEGVMRGVRALYACLGKRLAREEEAGVKGPRRWSLLARPAIEMFCCGIGFICGKQMEIGVWDRLGWVLILFVGYAILLVWLEKKKEKRGKGRIEMQADVELRDSMRGLRQSWEISTSDIAAMQCRSMVENMVDDVVDNADMDVLGEMRREGADAMTAAIDGLQRIVDER